MSKPFARSAVATTILLLSICSIAGAQDQGPTVADAVVTTEGMAACASDHVSCRRAALADALRRAVEKGIGVMLSAGTITSNYQLVEDKVRTSAEGFVKDYRVLNETREDGVCRITVEAHVSPGSPEQSLRFICRRLKEEVDPLFAVNAGDSVTENALAGEFALLGLRTDIEGKGSPGIRIRGEVRAEPLGEAIVGSGFFSSDAVASLSVADTSGLALPSTNTSLDQPALGMSQDQADRRAVEKTCKLWIRRNLPIIAAVLMDDGKSFTAVAPPEDSDTPAAPTPTWNPPDTTSVPSDDTPPPQGPRVRIDPDAMHRLAVKLKSAVQEKSEFGSLPISIAVARFRTIGISDPALAEDVLEDLSTALVKMEVFELVERSQLDKVLQELRIQNYGLIDSSTAKRLGKLVGAQAVLVGSISDRKDCFVINARLINTESGTVRIAESMVIDKEDERKPVILKAGSGR